MAANKHPRVSMPVDTPDPIYNHLDPISCSLQERVKFGGHITSITKRHHMRIPFYFQLSERDEADHVTKRAVFAKEIEQEENSDLGQKLRGIKKDIVDKRE